MTPQPIPLALSDGLRRIDHASEHPLFDFHISWTGKRGRSHSIADMARILEAAPLNARMRQVTAATHALFDRWLPHQCNVTLRWRTPAAPIASMLPALLLERVQPFADQVRDLAV